VKLRLVVRALFALLISLVFATNHAQAVPVGTYDLDILSASLGGVGTRLGQITVTSGGFVRVDLDAGISFTGPGNTLGFGFNLDMPASSTISGPTNLAFTPPPQSGNPTVTPFGTFSYVVGCLSCNSGTFGLFLTESAPGFSNANFVANSQGYYFLAQVANVAGATGYIGLASAVPEPSTWAMMILGFAGVVLLTYRRRKLSNALSAP
jgi:hypothetical protein